MGVLVVTDAGVANPLTVVCDFVNDNNVVLAELHYRQQLPLPGIIVDHPVPPADLANGFYQVSFDLVAGDEFTVYRLIALVYDASGIVEAPAVNYQPRQLPVDTSDPPLAQVADWPDPVPSNAAGLIAQASELVRAHCGWQISYRASDRVLVDYQGETILGLPSLHVTGVTSLEVNNPDGTATVVDPAGYDWYEIGQIVLKYGRPQAGPRRYTATVGHGYDPIPLAVSSATIAVARALDENPLGANSVRVGDVSVTYGAGDKVSGLAVLTSVDAALAPYRIPVVA